MSEEDLELLMWDRQVGVKVREIALVYQGVDFVERESTMGMGLGAEIWRNASDAIFEISASALSHRQCRLRAPRFRRC